MNERFAVPDLTPTPVGILPTVPVVPTREGVAAGRDEVLEKGLEVVAR